MNFNSTMYRPLLILVLVLHAVCSFSDVGKWDLPLSGEKCDLTLAKSLFKGTKLIVRLHCDVVNPTNITITYTVILTQCSLDYYHFYEPQVVQCTQRKKRSIHYKNDTLVLYKEQTQTCNGRNTIFFFDENSSNKKSSDKNEIAQSKSPSPLLTVEADGEYLFRMTVQSDTFFNGSLRVEMASPQGYLSAAIWTLLPFFGIMCAVYTILCTCWLIVCGLQWRDLLRIQYWIGGVALLGMIETSIYYGLYSSINNTGYFNETAYMFAEFLSIAKRALARMLVIIVSLGFGIVKPRLGPALQRVVGTGLLWGVLASIEVWLRMNHQVEEHNAGNRDTLLAEVPLCLLDGAICWWIFVSLAHTMRTLQLRRNTVKFSLYKHFTNTLIFAVISSIVFMLYTVKTFRVTDCIIEWRGVWIDVAYWHILFVSILTVIMVLWRPTQNNQRYAFTPLLDNADDDDDEEEDQFVNDAYGVKMRSTSISEGTTAADSKDQDNRHNSLEADLRWVEENIPTSSLPLLDSDEEIINTKFEVSKMQ